MSRLRQFATRVLGSDPVFARKTFGGIKPPAHKLHSLRSRIMNTPIPAELRIPLGTRDEEAVALHIEIGQRVLKYQKLAEVSTDEWNTSTLPVHAPTSGTITSLELAAVADHRNTEQLCLHLETDGHDEAIELESTQAIERLGSAEIASRIRNAGLLGMGGAGFPAAAKIDSAAGFDIELLIVNCAECEPYISADEALIRERTESVVAGAELLRRASSARRCLIAIEDSKPDAIAALRLALKSEAAPAQSCEIVLIPSKYPAGSERQLIQCLTGIEVPTGEYPNQSGILVQNCGTAYAAFEAVALGRPCISRITTLCGAALTTPKNFEVLIGSSVDFLFNLCGLQAGALEKTVVGGSLMGRELASGQSSVGKTTNCLIAADARELPPIAEAQACIRCGFCADACPARLLPQQLLALGKSEDPNDLIEHGLFDCIECGACDYVCPSHIPLVSIFKDNKSTIAAREQDRQRSDYWRKRFQYRQYRIKKEKEQAVSSKAASKKQAIAVSQPAAESSGSTVSDFSKEQASREIAAAVARVKARRSQKTPDDDGTK